MISIIIFTIILNTITIVIISIIIIAIIINIIIIFIIITAEICYIHGDPHFNTTDGKVYTFHGEVPCDYHLVTHDDFEIVGTFVACKRPHVSCLSKVQINYAGDTWTLGPKGAVTDDVGNSETLPVTTNDIEIKSSGKNIEASLDNSVRVTWDKKRAATILIPVSYMNVLTGKYTE